MNSKLPYQHEQSMWDYEPMQADGDDGSWMIIYLDVITLVLCIFVVLMALSQSQLEQTRVVQQAIDAVNPDSLETPQEIPTEGVIELETTKDTNPMDAQANELRERFRQALLDQNLQESVELSVDLDQITLQISERILFQSGQAALEVLGKTVLSQISPLLNLSDNQFISVEGHTDTTPISNENFPSNWELSTQRATTVLKFLQSQGISEQRMRAIGYAATRPIDNNTTNQGRARNRRVELVLQISTNE